MAFKIFRCPNLTIDFICLGCVGKHRDRGNGIQSGHINEWFKRAAGLTAGLGNTIELTFAVITPTDHRQNMTGFRLHHHHSPLQLLVG